MVSFLFSLLFPVRCVGCKTYGIALCEQCVRTIPFAPDTHTASTFAVFSYGNTIVERAIRSMKYYRRTEASVAHMEYAAPHIAEWIGSKIHAASVETMVLVPIPLHRTKARARGFNQSSILAEALAAYLSAASVQILIEKFRKTTPQAQLKSKHERLVNIQNSMQAADSVDPKNLYLVIDDVTTTGATLAEAMRALKNAGATKVLGVALAHGNAQRF